VARGVGIVSAVLVTGATGQVGGAPALGWEAAREVTAILVDAATPNDGYTAELA
jgi:uncharacterized protein YbjT (DUF2867 family)